MCCSNTDGSVWFVVFIHLCPLKMSVVVKFKKSSSRSETYSFHSHLRNSSSVCLGSYFLHSIPVYASFPTRLNDWEVNRDISFSSHCEHEHVLTEYQSNLILLMIRYCSCISTNLISFLLLAVYWLLLGAEAAWAQALPESPLTFDTFIYLHSWKLPKRTDWQE